MYKNKMSANYNMRVSKSGRSIKIGIYKQLPIFGRTNNVGKGGLNVKLERELEKRYYQVVSPKLYDILRERNLFLRDGKLVKYSSQKFFSKEKKLLKKWFNRGFTLVDGRIVRKRNVWVSFLITGEYRRKRSDGSWGEWYSLAQSQINRSVSQQLDVTTMSVDEFIQQEIENWEQKHKGESPMEFRRLGHTQKGVSPVQKGKPMKFIKMNKAFAFRLSDDIMTENPIKEWDTNEGKCVYDFIKWRYGKVRGLKKKTKIEYLKDFFKEHDIYEHDEYEEDYNEWGVNTHQIREWCKECNIPMIALDQNEKHFMKYPDETEKPTFKRNKDAPTFVFRMIDNHLYAILGKKEIMKCAHISNSSTSMVNYNLDDKEEVVTDYEIIEVDSVENEDKYQYLYNKMVEENVLVRSKNINMVNKDIMDFVIGNKKYVFMNDSTNAGKKYCELNNINYQGESITSITYKHFKEECVKVKSTPNDIVNNIFLRKGIKSRVHVGLVKDHYRRLFYNFVGESQAYKNNLKCYDIRKCYSKCVQDPYEPWMTIDWDSIPIPYDGDEIFLGLFYVVTNDFKLMGGDNIYSTSIVKKALKEKIITKEDIKWYIKASKKKNTNYFDKLLKKLKEVSHDDIDLNKQMNNLITGMLGKTISTKVAINTSRDSNEVWNYMMNEEENPFLFPYNEIYFYGTIRKKKIREHPLPIYLQILDDSNIRLYDMIKATEGTCIYRKTDCCVVIGGKDISTDEETWGTYRKEEIPTKIWSNRNSIRGVKLNYDHYNKDWDRHAEIDDSEKWEEILQIAEDNGGCMVLGYPGTGKSYCIHQIAHQRKTLKLCFTNKGALNIHGQTVHRALNIDGEGRIPAKTLKKIAQNYQLIAVDEISMNSAMIWRRIEYLVEYTKLPIILFGDFQQLPPIEDGDKDSHYYFRHEAVKQLSKYQLVELEKVHRYDKELSCLLKDIREDKPIDKTKFKNKLCRYSVSYLNKTRRKINKIWNEKEREEGDLFIEKPTTYIDKEGQTITLNDDYPQDAYIYEGLPLIARRNIKKKEALFNNEEFVVEGIDGEKITCKSKMGRGKRNEDGELILDSNNVPIVEDHYYTCNAKYFHRDFLMGYCITIHKAQGSTIREKYTIHDWEILSKPLKYTALSRATKVSNINIII